MDPRDLSDLYIFLKLESWGHMYISNKSQVPTFQVICITFCTLKICPTLIVIMRFYFAIATMFIYLIDYISFDHDKSSSLMTGVCWYSFSSDNQDDPKVAYFTVFTRRVTTYLWQDVQLSDYQSHLTAHGSQIKSNTELIGHPLTPMQWF